MSDEGALLPPAQATGENGVRVDLIAVLIENNSCAGPIVQVSDRESRSNESRNPTRACMLTNLERILVKWEPFHCGPHP